MAKRVRVTKQEAVEPTLTDLTDAAKMPNATVKVKTTTPSNAEGKHVMLPAFLSKTYEIFSMPEFSHVCGWNATGDTIIVSQLETFVAMVLPRFFKHRNFPSFVRQLNLYGFHKTVLDSKRLEFQHPYFKRGRPDLLHHIKRKVSSSNNNHSNQQLVSTSIQNSRLDAHREISDTLLREMKELRQRSDAMEKRLREVEIDNAIVRSDNMKLWKHLEAAKDKQLVMQEKMKKIMWILFQIYRGKQQNLPKLSNNDVTGAVISEDYSNSSILGPKEFRDVMRFLAMDEPPMLPGSTANVESATPGMRKRKFVEVSPDVGVVHSTDDTTFKFDKSVIEVPSSMELPNPFAVTFSSSNAPSSTHEGQNNILSIFSPASAANSNAASVDPAKNGFVANGVDSTTTSSSTPMVSTPTVSTSPSTVTSPAESTLNIGSPTVSSETKSPVESIAASKSTSSPDTNPNSQLAFLDEELPLLSDSDHYNFTDGEQAVMKKLEDFETSLLDEYDVSCLDSLLQQLKNGGADKLAGIPVSDSEEVVVGPTNSLPNDA